MLRWSSVLGWDSNSPPEGVQGIKRSVTLWAKRTTDGKVGTIATCNKHKGNHIINLRRLLLSRLGRKESERAATDVHFGVKKQ